MLVRFRKLQGIAVLVATLFLLFGLSDIAGAEPRETLKAAFVRDGDLWIRSGGTERRLTEGKQVSRPQWSFDGEWIAYQEGEETPNLKLWHVTSGNSLAVLAEGIADFQWSPDRNELAYTADRKLSTVRPDRQGGPRTVAEGIGSFSWLPEGNGFIASSAVSLLPDGWERVRILKIPLAGEAETLYTLPQASDDFFAVGTSGFKYSPSGKWIAFLATPTASLSADGNNYLCLLSSDGTSFHAVDQMLNRSEWFQWANREDTLAYIAGVGREVSRNKVLKTVRIPASGKPASYTPKGFVDQGFAWAGADRIIASRAKEYEGEGGIESWPLPKLVEIRLQGNRASSVTEPPQGYGDFAPQFFPREQRLVWVRSNRNQADALISGRGGKHPSVWIKNIGSGRQYYGYGNWGEVLAVYG